MSGRYRPSSAVAVAVALAVGIAVPGRSAAASRASKLSAAARSAGRSVALTWAPAYMASPQSYSEQQAVQLALDNDVVAGTPMVLSRYAAAMRNANPRV